MTRFFLLLIAVSILDIAPLQGQTYKDWVDSSFIAIDKKEYDKAEKALLNALRAEPANAQNVILLSNLGTIQRTQGKLKEALQSYDNALIIAPRSVTLLLNRAALYDDTQEWGKAMIDYNHVLLLEDTHQEALYRRAMLNIAQGDTAASRKDLDRLAGLNKHSTTLYIGKASLYLARQMYAEAIDYYTQAIKLLPQQASLYLGRGEAYYQLKKWNKALADTNQAIEIDNMDGYAFLLRGKIRKALYEDDKASADFEKAHSLGVQE